MSVEIRDAPRASLPFARVATVGVVAMLAACAAKPEPAETKPESQSALVRDTRPSPGFDASGADCAGRLYRDTEHAVSGASECKNGAHVVFSGRSDATLAEGLSCDYALSYTSDHGGTGRVACTDGSTGIFLFEERDRAHGVATVRMKDGREIKLTYTQSS